MTDTLRVHTGRPTWDKATVTVGDDQFVVTTVRAAGELNVYIDALEPEALAMAEKCQEYRDDNQTTYCRASWCARCNALRKENGHV